MAKRPGKPANTPWLSPALTVKDPDAAMAFYQKAFGFEKRMAVPGPDGRTMHVEMAWRDSMFMFGPEGGQNKCQSPVTSGVRPAVSLYVYCDDVDGLFKRATAAGAKAETPPQDMFWGDRACTLIDPDGHIWYFATNVADFDPSKVPGKA
jgi:PhnB protein